MEELNMNLKEEIKNYNLSLGDDSMEETFQGLGRHGLFHNICIDKMKALFPIKKEYVKKIFDGSKAYEYRKSFCSLEVDTIVIYESRGKGLVVGEFEIADRLCDTPRNIWERTKGYAGISESDFFSYFEGRDKACAYVVGNVNVFLKPKTLQDYGINVVPQNFCYIR